MARTRIIDVSQWNGSIDWDQVKGNVDAAIIRMGFTYSRTGDICIDKSYVVNRKTCKAKNIPYSLYYFTNAINEEEARKEAEFVAYECRDLSRYILPVFVDSEIVDGLGRADNLDKETRTKCIRAFCSTLQANAIPAGFYCNPDFLANHVDRSKLPYSLWLASWGVKDPGISDYTIWQYTNSGSIPGISGRVDISTEPTPQSISDADQVLALALAEVDYLEKKNGDLRYLYTKDQNVGSNNYTKFNYEMHQLQSNMDYPAAWCAAFVCWAFVKYYGFSRAKKVLCGDIDDYVPILWRNFSNAGRIVSTPQKGDLIFFWNSTHTELGHVGLVREVNTNMVYTVEGNTSSSYGVEANGGCVRLKGYTRAYPRIAGFGRPLWEDQ